MTEHGAAAGERGLPAALSVAHLTHAFGQVRALEDVSLEVPAGCFCALLGVNGAGKTTLLAVATGLYAGAGSVAICGYDLSRRPGPALARTGVVFQSRALDPGLTVRENLLYHGALHGLPGREAGRRADALLARAGLAERAGTRIAALSGGQVRRIEIARALLHDPRLLLLDEPTAGLDAHARRDLVALVRALAAERGVGVLWATHLLDEIAPKDLAVILHRGRVLARGTAAKIAGDAGLAPAFLRLTGAEPRDIAR